MNSRNDIQQLIQQSGNPELRAAFIELCEHGLLTCTRGKPGDDDATYALAWLPLDNPERYPASIQKLHEENMRRFSGK